MEPSAPTTPDHLPADLAGRHVVITGATGGLGGAVVAHALARGAIVHAPVLEASVPPALRGAPHGDRLHVTPSIDLGDEAAVAAWYRALPAAWASLHLVGGFTMAPIAETRLADLDQMLAINTRTCFLACREAVIAMRRGGGGGRIVNVVARPALAPTGGMVAYAASKAAVASITLCLAAEVAAEGIWVNAIAPSIIDTPANRAAMPAADHARWPRPAELARAILDLASPANALTSGALLPVYGRA
ncbi:MAG: SDR family NAD(P)-dependent oxidoreductase [Myxococcales bacterium]|nr:SDR family NAD(P)-dependent oxidoreductase [Myxococcales bacterium]